MAGYTYLIGYNAKDSNGNYAGAGDNNHVRVNVLAPITTTTAPAPTASLSVTPSTVTAGQNITYNWSSTNAASWSWSLEIYDNTQNGSPKVDSDRCGTVASSWTGPGNTPSGTWSSATSACQAGYTYYITYRATGSGGQASNQQFVKVVAPSSSSSTSTSSGSTSSGATNQTTTTTSAAPTVNLSVTPSTVVAGQNVTYTWSSTNGVSWSWYMVMADKNGVQVPSDGCGTVASKWTGPTNGNSASGTFTAPTAICQAGYTYYIYYKATNSSGQTVNTLPAAIVSVVSPTASASSGTNSNLANVFDTLKSGLNSFLKAFK